MRPPIIAETWTTPEGGAGLRIRHPEGVDCDFADGKCSCGRLDIGVIRDSSLSARNAYEMFEEAMATTTDVPWWLTDAHPDCDHVTEVRWESPGYEYRVTWPCGLIATLPDPDIGAHQRNLRWEGWARHHDEQLAVLERIANHLEPL